MPTPVENLNQYRAWVESDVVASHLDPRFIDALSALNSAVSKQFARKGLARAFAPGSVPVNVLPIFRPR